MHRTHSTSNAVPGVCGVGRPARHQALHPHRLHGTPHQALPRRTRNAVDSSINSSTDLPPRLADLEDTRVQGRGRPRLPILYT